MPGIIVIGAGPGIGRAVAARFAKEGLPVALIARTEEGLSEVAATLPRGATYTADVTDAPALRGALDQAIDEHGLPDAVVYNAAVIRPDRPGEIDADELARTFTVNVGGALTVAAHVAPRMTTGSFLITGGMPDPAPGYLSLSVGKAALRTLTALLAEEYAHLHIVTITIGGAVAPGTRYDPDDIADHYWRLHSQPSATWEREVLL